MLVPKLLSGINILWLICREGNLPEVSVLERTVPVTLQRQATSQISEMSHSRDKSYRQRVFVLLLWPLSYVSRGVLNSVEGTGVKKTAEEDISKSKGSLL